MASDTKTMRVSDLSFDSIKTNLKTFLQQQGNFADYNFEGSALSTIVDLLAYNTMYNSIIANQLANECFLDTAVNRGSVVSHAKGLGYYPISYRCPVAIVDITINNPVGSPTSISLPKGSTFTSSVNGMSYTFVTLDNYETSPVAGVYIFHDVTLYEGTLSTYSYIVNNSSSQKYVIPNKAVDLTTVKVYVQNSTSDTTLNLYTESKDITRLISTTQAYFIQGNMNNLYEVYFGDDILGKSVIDGNIVIIEYVSTHGSICNGVKVFSASTNIYDCESTSISTTSIAIGGNEYESIESIKKNAPKAFTSQNRMVTVEDIRTILPLIYTNIKSISVWGGDENVPPDYGVVYVSIEPFNHGILTAQEKVSVINSINEKKVISIDYKIVDPEYIYIEVNSTVHYDQSISLYAINTMKLLAKNAIMTYNNTELSKFKGVFRYSKLSSLIDAVDKSVLSNITTFKLKKYLLPTYGIETNYNIEFHNPIYKNSMGTPEGAVSSSGFTIIGDDRIFYFNDDGNLNIRMYYLDNTTKIYINNNIGTVDYVKGIILLTLNISTFLETNNNPGLEVIIVPQSNDVIPVRNTILRIMEENVTTNAVVDTISNGYQSGANYIFTPSR